MREIWKHPIKFWHWSSRWDWFTVLGLGGLGFVAVNEAVVGLFLIFLSLLSLTSKLWHGNNGPLIKISGTGGVALAMVLCTMATVAFMEEKPWSNVPVFFHRYVFLANISKGEMPISLKLPTYPPKFDSFPQTVMPTPKAEDNPRGPEESRLKRDINRFIVDIAAFLAERKGDSPGFDALGVPAIGVENGVKLEGVRTKYQNETVKRFKDEFGRRCVRIVDQLEFLGIKNEGISTLRTICENPKDMLGIQSVPRLLKEAANQLK